MINELEFNIRNETMAFCRKNPSYGLSYAFGIVAGMERYLGALGENNVRENANYPDVFKQLRIAPLNDEQKIHFYRAKVKGMLYMYNAVKDIIMEPDNFARHGHLTEASRKSVIQRYEQAARSVYRSLQEELDEPLLSLEIALLSHLRPTKPSNN
ncbi:hypothetical protein HYS31_03660 [Candidatus Woesearchaeota archaeon]|nr:hypothetical protein [Candidatus Woesearchaeota archaeon]